MKKVPFSLTLPEKLNTLGLDSDAMATQKPLWWQGNVLSLVKRYAFILGAGETFLHD